MVSKYSTDLSEAQLPAAAVKDDCKEKDSEGDTGKKDLESSV